MPFDLRLNFFLPMLVISCGGQRTVSSDLSSTTSEIQSAEYENLSATGLYDDFATRTLADGVYPYEPRFALYSDGLIKTRWIRLPPGQSIEVESLDVWRFPIGTKLFKEFAVQVNDELYRLETRLLERRKGYWAAASFIWNDKQTEATLWGGNDGSVPVIRTLPSDASAANQHEIPSISQCVLCHQQGGRDIVLGASAFQLRKSTMRSWADLGLLQDIEVPGQVHRTFARTVQERDVIGYVHANCGSCHNAQRPEVIPGGGDSFHLNYELETTTGLSSINLMRQIAKPPTNSDIGLPQLPADAKIIAAGEPERSVLYLRMHAAPERYRMPLIRSQTADRQFIENTLRGWILSLER